MPPLLPPDVSVEVASFLVALSFVTSAVTASLGLGGGMLMLTALASIFPPAILHSVHSVVQIGSNGGRAIILREHIRARLVVVFTLGGVLGTAFAAQVFIALPGAVLQMILASFILYTVWGPKPKTNDVSERGFFAVGALSSFCNVFVGGTGPFVAAFLSPELLGRHGFVATHGACVSLQYVLKAIAFGFIGFHYVAWAPLLTMMIALGFLGTMAGRRLLDRLPERVFQVTFKWLLTLLAVRLGWVALP